MSLTTQMSTPLSLVNMVYKLGNEIPVIRASQAIIIPLNLVVKGSLTQQNHGCPLFFWSLAVSFFFFFVGQGTGSWAPNSSLPGAKGSEPSVVYR